MKSCIGKMDNYGNCGTVKPLVLVNLSHLSSRKEGRLMPRAWP